MSKDVEHIPSGRPPDSRTEPEETATLAAAAVAVRLNLAAAEGVRVRVSGCCMSPALEPGDVVVLERRRPRFGDVVLVELPTGLRLHRVVFALPGGPWVRTKGDNSDPWDPRVARARVVATAAQAESPDRVRRPTASRWRALVSLLSAFRWRARIAPEGRTWHR